MADIALLASQADDAPLGYQVPGAQEIILKSITASFDGTGAAGTFVPTLQILAPNGAVLAACPVSTQVAAGASADVSWFPRGGLNTSGSYTPPTAWQIWTDSATIAAGARMVLTWADPGTHLPDSSGGAPFPFLDLSDVLDPAVLTDGNYSVAVAVSTSDRAAVGDYLLVDLFIAQAGADYSPETTIDVGANVLAGLPVSALMADTFPIFAGDSFAAVVTNKTASPLVVRWTTAVSKVT